MKVAMLSRDGPDAIGGIPTVINYLQPRLFELGVDVTSFSGRGRTWRTYALPLLYDLTAFDLIHVQGSPYGPWSKVDGKPLVVTVHSLLAEEMKYRTGYRKLAHRIGRRYLEKKTLKEADAIIAVSETTRVSILENTEADPSKVVVIPNGVDLDRFKPDKSGMEKPVLLVCSRVDPRKNIAQALDAVQFLGPRVAPLLALGQLKAEQVVRAYQVADIFLTTSFSEGFNLSLLEAMASGCCCVASDIPAHRELIEDGVNGFLYHTKAGMEDLLLRLVNVSYLTRASIGMSARKRAQSYPWSNTAVMTKAVYERVLWE